MNNPDMIQFSHISNYTYCPHRFLLSMEKGVEVPQLFSSYIIKTLSKEFHDLLEVKAKGTAAVREKKYTLDKLLNTLYVASKQALVDSTIKLPSDSYMKRLMKNYETIVTNFWNVIYTSDMNIIMGPDEFVVPSLKGDAITSDIDFAVRHKKSDNISVMLFDFASPNGEGVARSLTIKQALAYHYFSGSGHKLQITRGTIDVRVFDLLKHEVITPDTRMLVNIMEDITSIVAKIDTKPSLLNADNIYRRLGFWCENSCPYYTICMEQLRT